MTSDTQPEMTNPARGPDTTTPRRRGRPEGSGVAVVTRVNILRAAVYCFARSGYAQTSNRDIAQAAGITSGSLYHYFDSKAAIFQEALRQCTLTLVETYRAACTETSALSCVDQLCHGLERVIGLSRDWPGIIRFGGNAAAEIRHNRELEWLRADVADAFPAFFRELLQRAEARGELAEGVGVDDAAGLLLTLTMGLSISHETDGDEDQFAARVRAFERLLRGQLLRALPATAHNGRDRK
jgi:AcrR family transcriptional regulator